MNSLEIIRARNGRISGQGGVCSCPVCQPESRPDQLALSLDDSGGKMLAHCFKSGCSFRDLAGALGLATDKFEADPIAIAEARRKREDEHAARVEKALKRCKSIWESAGPIEGTHGEAYLRGRGITCDLPNTLRWHPDTYHKTGYQMAMVARVSTGAIHRTFFDKRTKHRVAKDQGAKMMLGPCAGGHVRLSDCLGPLVVCEGIETGLSLASGLLSGPSTVWATLSASGLRAVELPSRAGKLVIASDGDSTGQEASCDLASRAHSLGWEVSLLPAPQGRDWNDVLVGKEASA